MSTPLVVLIAAVALLIAAILVDLARAEVRHLPKWAWALIIVLVSFPIGAIVYLVVGRVPAAERSAQVARSEESAPSPTAYEMPTGQPRGAPSSVESGPAVIETRGLTKVYGETVALDDVDLLVPRGMTYGLIGPNGAGKTTMLSILSGLRRPTSGTYELAVERRRIGVLPDTPHFEPWLTAREVVDLARNLVAPDQPRDRIEAVLVEVGLKDSIDRRAGGFSRGMLQRLGFAACLVGDPEVLILDEPSSALDPAGRREMLDLIGHLAQTKTVILSTHILADVQQVCDVVGVIDHGRLQFQGPLTDLLGRTSAAITVHVRPPADGLADALRKREWVVSVTDRGPGRFHVVVSDVGSAERELPALVAERRLSLVSVYPATDLETAFLELTS